MKWYARFEDIDGECTDYGPFSTKEAAEGFGELFCEGKGFEIILKW